MHQRCLSLVAAGSSAHRVVEPLEARTYFSHVVNFSKVVSYPTGTYPSDVVTADLANNGTTDVITSNFGSASIAVLRGNGDGSLQAPVIYPVGNEPQSLAVGDLNGDGVPDIVTANAASNSISILLGVGDGTFAPQVQLPTDLRPQEVALSDLTGDGLLDIVTVNQVANDISVFINNGNGTFAPAVQYNVGLNPTGLAIADLNGDERPDIVTVNPTNSNIHVLLNKGDGTFATPVVYATGQTAGAIGILDVNADGRPDIITANLHGTSISELLGVGNGTFQAHSEFTTGAFPFSITIADINGDGRPDIITANNFDNNIGVLVHNGKGSFNTEIAFKTGYRASPVATAVGDLNGDGRPDLVAVNFNTNTVSVMLNQTPFVALIPTTLTLTPGQNPVQAENKLTLTLQLTATAPGKTPPTGRVQIFNGDAVLAAPAIPRSGTVTIHIRLPEGTHTLVAHYSGDSAYGQSLAAQVVEQAVPAAQATPLVAADIVAQHVPPVVVPGDHGSVALSLQNQGDGTAVGVVGIALYASTDGTTTNAIALTTTPAATKLNLPGGQSKVINVGFSFPAGAFEPGQYTILAVLAPVSGLIAGQVSTTAAAAATSFQAVLQFGAAGAHQHYTLVRTEGTSTVSLSLAGPGNGAVTENSDGSISITLTGTSGGSQLTIATHGGSNSVVLDDLTSSLILGSINAQTTTIIGNMFVGSRLRKLTLAGSNGGAIVLGGGPAVTLSLGIANGLNLYAAAPIRSLTVNSWSNTSVDKINAPSIGKLISTGDFGPALLVNGDGVRRQPVIGTVVIGGSTDDAVWTIAGSIGRLQVGSIAAGWSGSITGKVTTLIDTGDFAGQVAAHSFGSIVIDGNVNSADILSGADFGADGRLGNNDDSFGHGTITTLNIGGSVTNTLIAAGLAPLGDVLIGPGTTLQRGAISAIKVGVTVDDATRIVAESLPTQAVIANVAVTTASDPRFQLQ